MPQNNSSDTSMNVAEYHCNSDIRIKQIKKPIISDNEILIKMEACGICGTDVMEWYRKKSAPKILGHEMSGTVAEIGSNVKDFNLDDRVFVSHHVPCYDCYYCSNNKYSACHSLHKGNFFPGGFAEYIRIPEPNIKYGTFKLPENMTFNEAAMIEPMACAVAGQKLLSMKKGETVLILGSGISGICHIILSKIMGLNVIATDISEYRINQALSFGADLSLHPSELNEKEIMDLNNKRLADKVIVCAGSSSAVSDAFSYIDRKGEILFFAIPQKNIELPSTALWRNEISLFFSYGAATCDIEETLDLYEREKINFRKMITHSVSLSDIVNGFKLVENANDSIKVVVNPDKT